MLENLISCVMLQHSMRQWYFSLRTAVPRKVFWGESPSSQVKFCLIERSYSLVALQPGLE